MKVLAILILAVMIIFASICFLAFCMCAANASLSGDLTVGERMLWAIAAVVALGSIVGMAKLIRHLNRSVGF